MEPYYTNDKAGVTLYLGDCLDVMADIPDGSIDMVMTDPPYGTTACKWDSVIPLAPMWEQLKRIIKPNGAIVITASQPFTTALIASNMGMFKYCWVWRKSKPNGFQHAKNHPMMAVEDCCVFSLAPMGHVSQLGDSRMQYNPGDVKSVGMRTIKKSKHGRILGARPNQVGKKYKAFTGYPHNVLEFSNVCGSKAIHPTQKPVALMAYLIKTYTNEGETVLDFTMGSGTTGVAAMRLARNFVGIELHEPYMDIAIKRMDRERKQVKLF